MSDTPITDAAEFDFDEDCTPEDNMVVASCDMRRLERRLNESLERERVAITSWDEERQRALREAKRVLEIKADADALVLLLGAIMRDLPKNKDWLDPALERSANEALQTYRNKYPQ
jgi:hypothetical protein